MVKALPNQLQKDVATETAQALPDQLQKSVAAEATRTLPDEVKKDVVNMTVQGMPVADKKDVATRVFQDLSSKDRQDIIRDPDYQLINSRIRQWIIVVLISILTLCVAALVAAPLFNCPQTGTLTTIVAVTIGVLAGQLALIKTVEGDKSQ